jgi:hypothetical protein
MSLISHTFWLPRKGSIAAEYEDAAAADDAAGRYAVADGASEGCFTGLWATLLVDDFVRRAELGVEDWPRSLATVQELWDADVRGRRLPYHAQPWVRRGAYAAFLGIALGSSRQARYQWRAVAVGDTCLFHSRRGALVRAFPVERSQDFGNAPLLVGARLAAEEIEKRRHWWPDGRGLPGDRLWAMTDALAQWCLAEQEQGGNPWDQLESLLQGPSGDQRFAAWIEGLRDARRLRNDDVTLLAIPFKE